MPVTQTSDLQIGKKYFLVNDGEDARGALQVTLTELDFPTKLFPELSRITVSHSKSYEMMFYTFEIGIGETRQEAKANFGRLK